MRTAHCTLIEIPEPIEGAGATALPEPRALLPWADPYIAQLLAKHRVLAALSDSLEYLAAEAYRDEPVGDRYPMSSRFRCYPSPPGVQ